jgi:hypothetical protein
MRKAAADNPTAEPGLILIRKPEPEPPAELVEKALDCYAQIDRAEFASNLETARCMWRRHRDMVEAPSFPEPFLAALIEDTGHEPSDDCLREDALQTDHRERQLPMALETARGWAKEQGLLDAPAAARRVC